MKKINIFESNDHTWSTSPYTVKEKAVQKILVYSQADKWKQMKI